MTVKRGKKGDGIVPSRPRTWLKVLPIHVQNPETAMARVVLAFLDGGQVLPH